MSRDTLKHSEAVSEEIEYLYDENGDYNNKCIFKSLDTSHFKIVSGKSLLKEFKKEFKKLSKADIDDLEDELEAWEDYRYESTAGFTTVDRIRGGRLRYKLNELKNDYKTIAELWLADWVLVRYRGAAYAASLLARRFLLRAFNSKDIAIERDYAKREEKFTQDFEKHIQKVLESSGGSVTESTESDIDMFLNEHMPTNYIYILDIKYNNKYVRVPLEVSASLDLKDNTLLEFFEELADIELEADKVRNMLKELCNKTLNNKEHTLNYKFAVTDEEVCSDDNVNNLIELMESIDKKEFTERIKAVNWISTTMCIMCDEAIVGNGGRLWDGSSDDAIGSGTYLLDTIQALVLLYIYTKQGIVEPISMDCVQLDEAMTTLEGIEKAIEKEVRIRLEQLIYGFRLDSTLEYEINSWVELLEGHDDGSEVSLDGSGLKNVKISLESLIDIQESIMSCIRKLLNNCDNEFGFMPNVWDVCSKLCEYIELPDKQCKLAVQFECAGVKAKCETEIKLIRYSEDLTPASEFDGCVEADDNNEIGESMYNEYGFREFRLGDTYGRLVTGAYETLGLIARWNKTFGTGGPESELDNVKTILAEEVASNGLKLSLQTPDKKYELVVDKDNSMKTKKLTVEQACKGIAEAIDEAGYTETMIGWYTRHKYGLADLL